MKKLALLFTATFAAFQLHAADAGWLTDLPKAQEKAKAEKKLVLIDFTGFGTRHQRAVFWIAVGIWILLLVAFVPRHLMHVFGGE